MSRAPFPRAMPSGSLVLTRAPGPGLLPFVETLWALESTGDPTSAPTRREHVLHVETGR